MRRATSVLSFLRRPISVLTQATTRGKSSLSSASSAVASIAPRMRSALKRLSKRLRHSRHRGHHHGDSDASLKSSSTLSNPEGRAVCPSTLKRRLESSRAHRKSRGGLWRGGWWAGLWERRRDGCSDPSCRYYVDPHGKCAVHGSSFTSLLLHRSSNSPSLFFSHSLPFSLPSFPLHPPPYIMCRLFLPLLEASTARCFCVQCCGCSPACDL